MTWKDDLDVLARAGSHRDDKAQAAARIAVRLEMTDKLAERLKECVDAIEAAYGDYHRIPVGSRELVAVNLALDVLGKWEDGDPT